MRWREREFVTRHQENETLFSSSHNFFWLGSVWQIPGFSLSVDGSEGPTFFRVLALSSSLA